VQVGSRHSTTDLFISVSARNIFLLTCLLYLWRHNRVGSGHRVKRRRVGSGHGLKIWPSSISGSSTSSSSSSSLVAIITGQCSAPQKCIVYTLLLLNSGVAQKVKLVRLWFSMRLLWFLANFPTFRWHLSNSQTSPCFPDKWPHVLLCYSDEILSAWDVSLISYQQHSRVLCSSGQLLLHASRDKTEFGCCAFSSTNLERYTSCLCWGCTGTS